MCEVAVSVICNTYNHGKYIAQTLDGFVMQKTSFPFEVLVHDDASTDDTADIIRKYEKKYPDIIKPIYQTVNQYSQKVKITPTYQFPRVKGRYIAYCEGDDFWTDPEKLQKQFDAMESHPEVDMCVHTTSKLYPDGKKVVVTACDTETIIPTEDIILGGGLSINTCSLMYRKSMLDVNWRFYDFMGYDYTLKIRGSLRGGLLCLPDNMGTYRFMSGPDSWTSRILKDNNKEIEHTKKRIQMLDYLDEDTDSKYADAICETKRKLEFNLLWYEDDYRSIKKPEFSDLYQKLSSKKKIMVKFGCVCPGLVKTFRHKVVNRYLKGYFR